jgi:hypothetical protein
MRQGLKQTSDFGWVQAVDHDPSWAHTSTTVQLLAQLIEVILDSLSSIHIDGV